MLVSFESKLNSMKKFILPFILSLFFFQNSFAYHIIGTEIGYESLGQDNYKIKLKVYRDCSSPLAAPFDDPVYMAIYEANSGLAILLPQLPFPGAQSITYQLCSPFPFSALRHLSASRQQRARMEGRKARVLHARYGSEQCDWR